MRNKFSLIIMVMLIAALPLAASAKLTPRKAPFKPKPKTAVKTAVKPAPKNPVEWAAKVNNDIISMDLYNKRVDAALKETTKKVSIEAAEEKGLIADTKKSVLEQMIEAVILLQWAEREGIEISDKTIKARIAEIKKSFPTVHEFHKSLAEQGMTVDDLSRDIKKQIIIDKLIAMRAKAVAITDEEIRSFYDKNADLYVQNNKFHLQQISRKDIKDIQTEKLKLDTGEIFSGDDLGIVEKGMLPVQDDSSIFELKTGDISDIIPGEAGYYIFKAVEVIPGRETKFQDVKDNIRKFLLNEKGRTQYTKDLQEEKASSKIILNEKLGILF